jgi:hypothetical protein
MGVGHSFFSPWVALRIAIGCFLLGTCASFVWYNLLFIYPHEYTISNLGLCSNFNIVLSNSKISRNLFCRWKPLWEWPLYHLGLVGITKEQSAWCDITYNRSYIWLGSHFHMVLYSLI